jgi:CBS domain-containing protein
MLVRDAMTTMVLTVTPWDRASDAVALLVERHITGLPVVDDDGRVLGILTELDLIRALRRGADPQLLLVADVMHTRPYFVEPDTDLYQAVALMEEWQVRRLPVCVGGRLAGIISRGDVLRTLARELPPRHQDGDGFVLSGPSFIYR